jgi:hypothetical protein
MNEKEMQDDIDMLANAYGHTIKRIYQELLEKYNITKDWKPVNKIEDEYIFRILKEDSDLVEKIVKKYFNKKGDSK